MIHAHTIRITMNDNHIAVCTSCTQKLKSATADCPPESCSICRLTWQLNDLKQKYDESLLKIAALEASNIQLQTRDQQMDLVSAEPTEEGASRLGFILSGDKHLVKLRGEHVSIIRELGNHKDLFFRTKPGATVAVAIEHAKEVLEKYKGDFHIAILAGSKDVEDESYTRPSCVASITGQLQELMLNPRVKSLTWCTIPGEVSNHEVDRVNDLVVGKLRKTGDVKCLDLRSISSKDEYTEAEHKHRWNLNGLRQVCNRLKQLVIDKLELSEIQVRELAKKGEAFQTPVDSKKTAPPKRSAAHTQREGGRGRGGTSSSMTPQAATHTQSEGGHARGNRGTLPPRPFTSRRECRGARGGYPHGNSTRGGRREHPYREDHTAPNRHLSSDRGGRGGRRGGQGRGRGGTREGVAYGGDQPTLGVTQQQLAQIVTAVTQAVTNALPSTSQARR